MRPLSSKKILAMPYGTSAQMDLMDAWYNRFMAFFERNEYMISDELWRFIHNTDIGYQARRRWTIINHG